ncbi:MAG: class I SAM-dependent methyltransferase [Planctomycetota bacterium]|nr:class I SAM-dependent methyltransferase [Planctomycetota bacterium]
MPLFKKKKDKLKIPKVTKDPEQHPERLAVLPYCESGRGLDVGCGHRKSSPNCIGVDLTAGGDKGEAGVVAGQVSQADVQASGDDLHMFADGELDFVVARHNIEHYVDPIKTIQEWKRVLRPGGKLAMIVPDDRYVDTIRLDPTHKHVFTPDSMRRILELIGDMREVEVREAVPEWSFLAAFEKV